MKIISGGVCAAKGFSASGVHCGIRKNRIKKDLTLIYSEKQANAAAVYTTNLVKGAPLTVTKMHIADGKAQAVICNSGNANTCNANGIEIAEQMSALLADALKTLPVRWLRSLQHTSREPAGSAGWHGCWAARLLCWV